MTLRFLIPYLSLTFIFHFIFGKKFPDKPRTLSAGFAISLLLIYFGVRPFLSREADPVFLTAVGMGLITGINATPARLKLVLAGFEKILRPVPWKIFIAALMLTAGALELGAQLATDAGLVKFIRPEKIAYTLIELDPVLHWRNPSRPPYNKQGFRGPEVSVPKPAGIFRIMCYGDSNTDGLTRKGWPFELQKPLEERPPDLVFVSFGWGDMNDYFLPNSKNIFPKEPFITLEQILFHYRFYQVLKYYSIHSPLSSAGKSRPLVPRVSLEEFRRLAGEHGARAVFLTRPYSKEKMIEPEKASVHIEKAAVYNAALLRFSETAGAEVIDVRQLFSGEKNETNYFDDQCHFNDAGYKVMVEFVYKELFH